MTGLREGSFRIFRLAGINVFLHWSWFLIAAYEIQSRTSQYSSIAWNVLEYLALFAIVTTHEFGHALACRQVGGNADQIVLWPLGGVAYVDPPQRAGAMLWSIAAGPLVNVALFPILAGLGMLSGAMHWAETMPDLHSFLRAVFYINFGLLVFNMLPIYPLDGGQILRSLLWFVMGRARSLMVSTVLGFAGMVGFIALAFWWRSPWFAVLAVFVLLNSWRGLQHARALLRLGKLPRRGGLACPSCQAAPPLGDLWLCGRCQKPFDIFATQAVCPHCGTRYAATRCMDCGRQHPIAEWAAPVLVRPLG
ncbi:MAG TPA: site-2 protease family protein [Candidatus Acidoferrum sp.]|nr:site-2 protease family protein [Candidatus Acidoferrum sp.]